MNQTKQYSESSPSPMFGITTSGMAIKVNCRRGIWTVLIFSALTVGTMIGVPLYGYLYHYSIRHLWGRQPHGTSDSSRDSWLVSLVTFGEGYHNYHHMYPTDYRNGPCWYHFDPSKWVIHGLYSLGLAISLRTGSYVEDSLTRTN